MPKNRVNSFARPAAVTALLVAGLAMSACGGDKAASSTASTTSAAATPTATATAPSASASASSSTSATPKAAPSTISNLDAITVSGAYGKAPAVAAKWPLAINKTQVKVLQPGKGAKVGAKGQVLVNYTGVNARTGKSFDTSFKTGGKPVAFPLDQVITGFRTGLQGQQIGSRVLIMMTPKDGYAQGNPQAGIEKTDSLIFVVDIISAELDAPSGENVAPKPGLPTVKDNGKGKAPTITTKGATIPGALTAQPLIKGTGPAVKATDGIVVNYTVVGAKDGKVLAENYTTGAETGMLSSLIPGWQKGLVGQTVGSRVLLIVPPADGYPKGNGTPSIPPGETLVYVVDILFANDAG